MATGRKGPVIFKFDMSKPETLFMAQVFGVRNNDTIYVTNAPTIEWLRSLAPLAQTLRPWAAPRASWGSQRALGLRATVSDGAFGRLDSPAAHRTANIHQRMSPHPAIHRFRVRCDAEGSDGRPRHDANNCRAPQAKPLTDTV